MLKVGKKKNKYFNKRMSVTVYQTLYQALRSLLTTEVKKQGADGKEIVDCAMTVSVMRMKARVALDFVDNLKNGVEKDNKSDL